MTAWVCVCVGGGPPRCPARLQVLPNTQKGKFPAADGISWHHSDFQAQDKAVSWSSEKELHLNFYFNKVVIQWEKRTESKKWQTWSAVYNLKHTELTNYDIHKYIYTNIYTQENNRPLSSLCLFTPCGKAHDREVSERLNLAVATPPSLSVGEDLYDSVNIVVSEMLSLCCFQK